ncbi:MAG: hypothetical protein K2V38_20385, partial [Gemmataceae bacterium]|nr:hypothetical protein [Gemmataceae bacterium]
RSDFARGRLTRAAVQRRLMGWLGHASQADSAPLLARVSRSWHFRRGRFQAFRLAGNPHVHARG